jgi:hypothetical protein
MLKVSQTCLAEAKEEKHRPATDGRIRACQLH